MVKGLSLATDHLSIPEKKEHFVQSSVAMLEILTETLKTSIRFEEK
jgi:hypothetical protein